MSEGQQPVEPQRPIMRVDTPPAPPRRRRFPRWTQRELDELRALLDAGEVLPMQRRILRRVQWSNLPWWRRLLERDRG